MVGCLGDQPLPLGGTPESPSLKHFFRNWGQETKYYPIALNLSSGNSKGFGSHEPGPVDEDETHMTNISEFGHLNDQIYVFWINPSITVCLRHLPGVESPHMPFWWAHLFFFFFFFKHFINFWQDKAFQVYLDLPTPTMELAISSKSFHSVYCPHRILKWVRVYA